MDWDERVEQANEQLTLKWFDGFNKQRGSIAGWVSSFRQQQPCELVTNSCGSFNWCCRVRFLDDDVQWMVRFPVPGKVMDRDEKLRREVATMLLLKERTTIPIPDVHAWGLAAHNPLGLGPFIIMDYVEGLSLGKLWQVAPIPDDGRILRSDIDLVQLQVVFRQIARFLLDLADLEFSRIGSLALQSPNSTESGGGSAGGTEEIRADVGPLTVKRQEIEAHGGVKLEGDLSRTFSSATEYFKSVVDQDIQHLRDQPNSVDNDEDARSKYGFLQQLKGIVPRFVTQEYDKGPFKLVCDDMRFGNMIVNNADELKIIAVIDWEWTYTAPYQMFFSPPRWLLIKKPIDWLAHDDVELTRYKECFEQFITALLQEENAKYEKTPTSLVPSPKDRLSSLMRQSLDDGHFWFHELIHTCYNGADNPAWRALCELHPDACNLTEIPAAELDSFVERKLKQLDVYHQEWGSTKSET